MFAILHEDDDILVVNKPAGLVCHPTKGDAYSSLISRLRLHLGDTARPHLVNRLDRETSGVVVVAKNTESARQLRIVWEIRAVRKQYLAISHGHLRDGEGTIDAPLGRDEASIVAVKDMVRADGSPSQTDYKLISRFRRSEGDFSLVRAWPRTGRKHQIRIHMAHLGHPIVGDKLYGGDEGVYLAFAQYRLTEEQRQKLILPNQALHAEQLDFRWRDRDWTFTAPPEPWFTAFHENDVSA